MTGKEVRDATKKLLNSELWAIVDANLLLAQMENANIACVRKESSIEEIRYAQGVYHALRNFREDLQNLTLLPEGEAKENEV